VVQGYLGSGTDLISAVAKPEKLWPMRDILAVRSKEKKTKGVMHNTGLVEIGYSDASTGAGGGQVTEPPGRSIRNGIVKALETNLHNLRSQWRTSISQLFTVLTEGKLL